MHKLNEENVSSNILREIARTEPWRLLWSTGKPNPFGISPLDWTDEQKIDAMVNHANGQWTISIYKQ